MLLIKGKSPNGEQYLFGGYCSKPMPNAPEYFDTETEVQVNSAQEDFFFLYIASQGLYFFRPNNSITCEIFTDYESGGAINMGTDFMQVSFSHDFRLQVGHTNALTEI